MRGAVLLLSLARQIAATAPPPATSTARAAAAAPPTACATFTDEASGQQLRIEAHGDHGIRVRAIPKGAIGFRDDLVSALLPLADGNEAAGDPRGGCAAMVAGDTAGVTSGNLRAVVLADGRLSFIRISDGKLLLEEKFVRELSLTMTVPPILPMGFQRLRLVRKTPLFGATFMRKRSFYRDRLRTNIGKTQKRRFFVQGFAAVEGERIYGLGQHKSGLLDNKGAKGLRLQPENTEILIPVAHSSEGYVFLLNLPSFGAVEYNSTGSYWVADTVLQVRARNIGIIRRVWRHIHRQTAII
jgi:hypothetical protein